MGDSICTLENAEGPSVCGTEQGTCYQCENLPWRADQGWCEGGGFCKGHSSHDMESCTQGGGEWLQGTWTKKDGLTKEQCEQPTCGVCESAEGGHRPEYEMCLGMNGQWKTMP